MHIPLEAVPSSSTFFLDYVRDWSAVERFYPNQHSLSEVAEFAAESVRLDQDHRERLAEVLGSQQGAWGVDPAPARRLASGAVAVITGQQAGLFTGPMYAVLKALTAVKVARALCAKGVDAVPVFWIASEDHDREEIEWAGILGQDSAFHKIRADFSAIDNAPVGWLHFTDQISEAIDNCFSILPSSEYGPEVADLLRKAYRPGSSPVDAFARMMAPLFEGTGMIFVDPLEPGFRSLSVDAMAPVAEQADAVRTAVLERSRQVSEAGYPEQVRVDDGFTGFFAYRDQAREPLRVGETAPASDLSPNALLRPFIQDSVFPTATYIGGPAEIAYFAQASAVYECFDRVMPPVFPRITATILEPPVSRVMKKYSFQMRDVYQGPDALRRKAVGVIHDTSEFGKTRDIVDASVAGLRPVLEDTDITLGSALDGALRKMRYQVDRLETRFVNAEARRNQTLDRQLRTVSNRLYPERKPQERTVNVTSFLARYGLGLVRMLDDRLELDGTVHQVVEL